jgi:signal transduction histidine kinase
MTLRGRLLFLLLAMVALNLAGGLATLWYANRTQELYSARINVNLAALAAAQGMQSTLTAQKGNVTYYFLSNDEKWLDNLESQQRAFEKWLDQAFSLSTRMPEREIVAAIQSEYLRFAFTRDLVINLYRQGQREDGAKLHWDVRRMFQNILDNCSKFKALHEAGMAEAEFAYRGQARWLTVMAMAAIPLIMVLALVLAWMLFGRILNPIRRLARELDAPGHAEDAGDEVEDLTGKVRALIHDVDSVRNKLDQSRERVLLSEKLALVGKLAAGVAHSIRNPLTSVKMRLFSLERTLHLDPVQKEDFEVVSEEITHIDTIVRNFLEFSRRPQLKTTLRSPSEAVDLSLQLLKHRFESHGIKVRLLRDDPLPPVHLDVEQLKEALVNILMNACDAMRNGGIITVREEHGVMEPHGKVVIIRIGDTGPGIPKVIIDSIFEPFYSTKEEGSGLGLAIAKRIAEEHGGWLHANSEEGSGATFVIALPSEEKEKWLRS